MTVEIRDLSAADIENIIAYWHDSPPGFLEAMGVDPFKIIPREQMRAALIAKCADFASGAVRANTVVILADGAPVGMHSLFPLTEGESGVFHAHIWSGEMRGKGIALKSYPLACKCFVERFNLKEIVFKTPVSNRGPNRVKEKLGLTGSGIEIGESPIMRQGLKVKVYRWTREEILAYSPRAERGE